MKKNLMGTMVGLLLLILSVSASVWAMDGLPERGVRRSPPPEAIAACKDKSEGTPVTFTTPRGETIKATCKQINGQLVAVPEVGFGGTKLPPTGEKQAGE